MLASYTRSLQRVLADELTHTHTHTRTDAQKQTNLTFHFAVDETRSLLARAAALHKS